MSNIKIEIHGKEAFLKEAEKVIPKIEESVGQNTVRFIQKAFTAFPKPPIQTGNLRRNIKYQNKQIIASTPLQPNKGKGGKEVEYAKFVEYGTIKMAPRPFMRNGIQDSLQSNESLIKKILKNG